MTMAIDNICGQGTLKDDLDLFLKNVLNKASAEALNDVGADMQGVLAKHIETDVYPAYSPSVYERRGNNGGLIAQAMEAKIYPHGPGGISIEFKPDGGHPTESAWAEVHGDSLIGRIEKHSPEYHWLPKRRKIPNRPFWQNFVRELIDDGTVEYYYAAAMRRRGIDLVEDGRVIREPNDGSY